MSDMRELYQQVILDHGRNPRNFKVTDTAQVEKDCFNPMCGDQIKVFCDYENDNNTFKALSFSGSGCAISIASASLMIVALQHKDKAYFQKAYGYLQQRLAGEDIDFSTEKSLSEEDLLHLKTIKMIAGVRDYPMRVKCATCAWHTMKSVVQGGHGTVKTE